MQELHLPGRRDPVGAVPIGSAHLRKDADLKKHLVRRGIAALGAIAMAAGFLATAAPPAHSTTTNIVLVGSDTIQNVDDALFAASNDYNVHAVPTSPKTVPADGVGCNTSVTYAGPPVPVGDVLSPNGSGNGRNALVHGSAYNPSAGNYGCVNIARSSGTPRPAGLNGTSQ